MSAFEFLAFLTYTRKSFANLLLLKNPISFGLVLNLENQILSKLAKHKNQEMK